MYIFTFLYVKMEESGGVRVTVHTIEGKMEQLQMEKHIFTYKRRILLCIYQSQQKS